jgi:hypothetical protein
MPAGDPSQDVHPFRVSQAMRDGIGEHFPQGTYAQVLEVINVARNLNTFHALDCLGVFSWNVSCTLAWPK